MRRRRGRSVPELSLEDRMRRRRGRSVPVPHADVSVVLGEPAGPKACAPKHSRFYARSKYALFQFCRGLEVVDRPSRQRARERDLGSGFRVLGSSGLSMAAARPLALGTRRAR